ncbi:GNAT family N-acetyltransferase [Nonomuraea dietziae]|uniref:GNAT family N-acetyltransferase n=1 Tax=Nonomuraea dietziae TaxID=65515 RepID=UPI0033F93D88
MAERGLRHAPDPARRALRGPRLARLLQRPGAAEPAWEIGWWIDPVAWGRGIAAEAATAVRRSGPVGRCTLVARHYRANEASGRIMTKLGMHLHDHGTDRYGRPCRISILPLRPRKPTHPTDRTRRSSRLAPPPVRAPPTSGWRIGRHGHRSRVLRPPHAGTTREEGERAITCI